MSRLLRALRSPTYSNSGSTARDHLASERTFLAWLRTGLGFIALGIAIERFSTLEPLIHRTLTNLDNVQSSSTTRSKEVVKKEEKSINLATAFTVLGSTAIIYGTQRYLVNLRMLQKGLYKPAYWGIAGFVGSVVGLSGYGIWDTFVRQRDTEQHAIQSS